MKYSHDQERGLARFLAVAYDLKLVSEDTFNNVIFHFDGDFWKNFSWEPPSEYLATRYWKK